MAEYLTTDTDLQSVADAIRAKGKTSAQLVWPAGYNDAINAINPLTLSVNTFGPSSIVTANDAADLDAKQVVVDIEPVQSGSGDPSPTNVRPITGWTGAEINGTGVNVWDEETEYGYYSATNGQAGSSINTQLRSKNYTSVKPSTSYCFKKPNALGDILFYDTNKSFISADINRPSNYVFTTPENCYYIRINLGANYGGTYNNDISINYPATDTQYHPYTGNQISVTFPSSAGTVYGGTLTINADGSGTLVVDRGYIASYAGETLPGEWISSMDVYTSGGTPTTGAQVVYVLASSVTYTLTAEQISLLPGINNIWSDCGNTTIEYFTEDFANLAEEIGFAEGGDY